MALSLMTTHSLILFVLAGLLLNITPGPDVLYIVARAASQGRTAGFVSAPGIAPAASCTSARPSRGCPPS